MNWQLRSIKVWNIVIATKNLSVADARGSELGSETTQQICYFPFKYLSFISLNIPIFFSEIFGNLFGFPRFLTLLY